MNRPSGHMRYRKSIYRKNRIKFILITTAVCICVIALLFVIIGNLVGKEVEENIDSRKEGTAESSSPPEHSAVRSVNACHVPLSESGSSLSARLQNAARGGYGEACFELDSPDGSLLYSSAVAQSLGKQPLGIDLWHLSSAVEQFDAHEFYSIGITHISAFSAEDDLSRAAAIGYHASLIAEAFRAGVDDILIYPSADTPHANFGELIRLADEVHRLCPEASALGLALPPSFLLTSENDASFSELWEAFDYISVDLASLPTGESDIVQYADSSLGGMLYYLLRYNLRVLIPSGTDSTDALRALAAAKGTQNIMSVPVKQ